MEPPVPRAATRSLHHGVRQAFVESTRHFIQAVNNPDQGQAPRRASQTTLNSMAAAVIERQTLYRQQAQFLTAAWMTLTPDRILQCWSVLLIDLGIDSGSGSRLIELLQADPPHGYQEGCRLLAHLLKIRVGEARIHSPSAWFNNALQESMRALNNRDTSGPSSSSRDPWADWHSSSTWHGSSSWSSWGDWSGGWGGAWGGWSWGGGWS